jgi:drug/metabolite transporter (DMT)-like permease
MTKYKKIGLSDVLMLLVVVVWSVNFLFVKQSLLELPPLIFNGIRLMVAAITLLIFAAAAGENFKVKKRDIWKIFVLGIIGNTFYQIFFILGFDLTTASNTSVILAMTPVFVALLSTMIRQEILHWAVWIGIFLSFVGLYLVIAGKSGTFQVSWEYIRGDVIVFSGVFFWAFYTVFSKPMLERISPLKWTALTMSAGALMFFLVSLNKIIVFDFQGVSLGTWIKLGYSGVFALGVGYFIWYLSVKRIGSSKTSVYSNMVPVFTIILSYFFLKESVSFIQALGAVTILTGVYLTRAGDRWFERKKKLPEYPY